MNTNKLKNFSKTILIGSMGLFTFQTEARADSFTNSGGDAILTQEEERSLRKRMPSINRIEITYKDGFLTLFSNVYEGEFSLDIKNIETGNKHQIPSIYIGESSYLELSCGEYWVTAKASDGSSLSGCMDIY